ncbi:peptidoglycan-binding domain-containing protein [Mycolicibacterium sp.]|uniref:peptidoglycan-binding domain-containing protein n=1 Tax=Mycolicibacterium sp. TaxID=2320850 RepID=UPI0028A5DCD0|nr:peptidoglycan-binding domain-containing protein [Mycolicibacterium sp.]
MALPYQLGSTGPEIEYWHAWFQRMYRAYAPEKDAYFSDEDAVAVKEMQRRLKMPETGVFDAATAERTHYVPPAPGLQPIMFTVEGHKSDMFRGPVADTAAALESEGLCHHQPIGYNNGCIPFDNASGVKELARLVGAPFMDNLVPFPQGTPWALAGFSQGGIVVSDFYFDYLAPGKPLDWRTPDLKAVLTYGNPCRQTDSIATWARSLITTPGTHGLDPKRRFGTSEFPKKPDYWVDVYREGDIFAENADDKASLMKAAVYQAVARGDGFSNAYSLAAQLSRLFDQPVETVLGIILACVSGLAFAGDQRNPHYMPYDIRGGIDWMRDRLLTGKRAATPLPSPL